MHSRYIKCFYDDMCYSKHTLENIIVVAFNSYCLFPFLITSSMVGLLVVVDVVISSSAFCFHSVVHCVFIVIVASNLLCNLSTIHLSWLIKF